MEVLGKVKYLGALQQVSDSFKKRELVVTTDEQYPQHILIEFTQDKADLLSSYKVGEPVKVSINLRGREWANPQGETKFFNSIQGWRIERTAGNQPVNPAPRTVAEPAQAFASAGGEDEADDLPF